MEAQTRQVRLPSTSSTQALANMGHLLQAAGCDHRHVVKTTVLLQDIDHFPLVDAVYGEVFAEAPPARATFQVPWEGKMGQVAALPRGALVEVEAVAVVGDLQHVARAALLAGFFTIIAFIAYCLK